MPGSQLPPIVVLDKRIDPAELKRLVELVFVDMVKLVIDVRAKRVAVGGELHADAEQLLLEEGSAQRDLWGANYYPGVGKERCIEYTALINIRPSQDNPSMEVQDPSIRNAMAEIIFEKIGQGEAL